MHSFRYAETQLLEIYMYRFTQGMLHVILYLDRIAHVYAR